MMKKTAILLLAGMIGLQGCTTERTHRLDTPGDPLSLLNASKETISLSLNNPEDVDQIVSWVDQDQPSYAQLYCMESDQLCREAQEVFDQFGVPVEYVPSVDNSVMLAYERITARDCNPAFLSNHINPYNMNHPGFGCSISANIVQHVSDKYQFVNPGMLDYMDAQKGVQSYLWYAMQRDPSQVQYFTEESALQAGGGVQP